MGGADRDLSHVQPAAQPNQAEPPPVLPGPVEPGGWHPRRNNGVGGHPGGAGTLCHANGPF